MKATNLAAGPAPTAVPAPPPAKLSTRETKQATGYVVAVDAAQGIVDAVVNVFGILDDGGDVVEAGAFVKTLTERGGRIKVLDQHRTDSAMRVIGRPVEMREIGRDELPAEVLAQHPDATGGLLTRTQYLLDTPEGLGVFKRIQAGALTEYSIGFDAVKTDWRKVSGTDGRAVNARIIKEARLWEYSPVIWGMNPATATVDVKGDEVGEPSGPALNGKGPHEPVVDDEDTQPLPEKVGEEAETDGTGPAPAVVASTPGATWMDTSPPPPLHKLERGENLPTDTKAATVGAAVMADIVGLTAVGPQFWLACGIITVDEYQTLSDLMVQAARMVYAGLPERLRDADLRGLYEDLDAAAGPEGVKVGRVLSAANYGKLSEAAALLTEVIQSAERVEDGKDTSPPAPLPGELVRTERGATQNAIGAGADEAAGRAEHQAQKASDGPAEPQSSQPLVESIALTGADVERDLNELIDLMVGWA